MYFEQHATTCHGNHDNVMEFTWTHYTLWVEHGRRLLVYDLLSRKNVVPLWKSYELRSKSISFIFVLVWKGTLQQCENYSDKFCFANIYSWVAERWKLMGINWNISIIYLHLVEHFLLYGKLTDSWNLASSQRVCVCCLVRGYVEGETCGGLVRCYVEGETCGGLPSSWENSDEFE